MMLDIASSRCPTRPGHDRDGLKFWMEFSQMAEFEKYSNFHHNFSKNTKTNDQKEQATVAVRKAIFRTHVIFENCAKELKENIFKMLS